MYIAWIFKNNVYFVDCANIGDEIVNFIKNNYEYNMGDTIEKASNKLYLQLDITCKHLYLKLEV